MPERAAAAVLPLDVVPFCGRGTTLALALGANELPRLADELAGRTLDVGIAGSLVQRRDLPEHEGRPMLTLRIVGRVSVPCARCLAPLDVPLDVEARFVVFATDVEADAALVDDEHHDAVAGLPRLDPRPLVEDEVLMDVPDTAHHDHCPAQSLAALGLQVAEEGTVRLEDKAASPFAVLAALRKH